MIPKDHKHDRHQGGADSYGDDDDNNDDEDEDDYNNTDDDNYNDGYSGYWKIGLLVEKLDLNRSLHRTHMPQEVKLPS